LGRVYKYSVLRGLHLQAGSRRLGFKPNTMTTKKMRFGLGCGYDVYPGGLESDTLGLGPQASEALDSATESFLAIKFGSLLVGAFLPPICQKVVMPTGEDLGGSTGTFPEFKSCSLSVGVSPLVAPVDISMSSDQPALVRQVELRQEVTTTNGMGPVLVDTPPEGADPGWCMVDGPNSFDFPSTVVNATFGGPVLDSKRFVFPSLGAAALGERIRLSLLMMSESGAPIYPPESKSVLRHHRKSKANTSQRVVSMFDEAVTAFRASLMLCLGASSQVLGWSWSIPHRS